MAGWFGRLVHRTLPAHRDRRPALCEDLERLGELARASAPATVSAP